MKIRKGDYGYIRREKKKRLLVTLGLFVLPAIVFIVGLVLADGNKSNIFYGCRRSRLSAGLPRRRRFYHDGYAKASGQSSVRCH